MNTIPINPQTLSNLLFMGYLAPEEERYQNAETLADLEEHTDTRKLAANIEEYTRGIDCQPMYVGLIRYVDCIEIASVSDTRQGALDAAMIDFAYNRGLQDMWKDDTRYYVLCISA